jgi:predicted amidohydrolase YtcJ
VVRSPNRKPTNDNRGSCGRDSSVPQRALVPRHSPAQSLHILFRPNAPAAHRTKADLVLINGTILTVDAKDSIAEALAISAGKIIAVGSKQQILALADAHTQALDLHGRTATPGLIDTHGHYQDAGVDELYNIKLTDAKSVAEIVRRVQARVAITKPGDWVLGSGWDEGKLAENRYVYASDLDKVSPNNPVWLQNTTGHYSAVNSYALRLAHITPETKDPPAGTIDRDAAGSPPAFSKSRQTSP